MFAVKKEIEDERIFNYVFFIHKNFKSYTHFYSN